MRALGISVDCQQIARQLVAEARTAPISAQRVRRRLSSHRLKPWRKQMWLSAKVPRDAAFAATVRRIADLYTRALLPRERVLCADEHTRLQPRPRLAPTRACRPGQPTQGEQEYRRCGAVNLLAALDTKAATSGARSPSASVRSSLLRCCHKLRRTCRKA